MRRTYPARSTVERLGWCCRQLDRLVAGVTLETIRRRLGHANAHTVLRYADPRDVTTDAEIRAWRRRGTTRRPNG